MIQTNRYFHNSNAQQDNRILLSLCQIDPRKIKDSILGDFELRHNSIFIVVFIPEARTSQSLCSFFGQHHEPRVPLENSTAPILCCHLSFLHSA